MKDVAFTMLLSEKGSDETWTEDIVCVLEKNETPYDRAKKILNDFNAYLRIGERPRVLIAVRLMKERKPGMFLKHNWVKKSAVTQSGGYDVMECTQCGATGKRHGLGAWTIIDKKYLKYEFSCPNTKK